MVTVRGTDLPELLSHLGYSVRRIGSYYTTKEMDSIRIKNRRSWRRYSSSQRGDAITFLQEFCGKSFPEAVEYLLAYHGRARDSPDAQRPRPPPVEEEKLPFVLPPAHTDQRRVFAYLRKRGIAPQVIQGFIQTEQGKYSARYALSELLVCGECGTPYKRCTWARNGKKRIVWRCVSRLEFGTKYCHDSPTVDETKLHRAIVAALNGYGATRSEVTGSALELAGIARYHGQEGGVSLLALKQRLDALTTEQALLLDKVLEDMDNPELNSQLKLLAEEKQDVLDQISRVQQTEAQQAAQASRMEELREWLDQQPAAFTEYNDTITRMFVERVTVVDTETIRVKIRDIDVELERKLC